MEAHADARAVELAREGEARFRLLVEHSSDGLYLMGPDGHVSYASPPVERLLGFDRRELTGRHFLDYLHPDDRDHAGWFFADILSKPGVGMRFHRPCPLCASRARNP
jgi:PAS domain S-box-containing protein